MKMLRPYAAFALVCSLFFVACKKDDAVNKNTPTTELSTSVQVSVTDDQVNDGINTALDAADGTEDGKSDMRVTGAANGRTTAGCAVVTIDEAAKKLTIDFGTGCVNPFTNRSRSGKIVIGYTGTNYASATQRTLQFIDYKSVDSVTLNGTFTQSNIVRTSNSVSYTISASNFIFLFADGKTHKLTTFTRNYVINLGANLRDVADNVTTITGSTVGVNKEGEEYTVNITSPVTFKGECLLSSIFYPASGSYDITVASKPKFTISWGTGSCDKKVSVTYFGITIEIALK